MAMFDFGKDLRKLFAQARDGDDLGWLELIGVPLLESEARQQTVDAGRVSCRRPSQAALRAAAVWREHARRTGRACSIARALDLSADAGREASGAEDMAEAMLDAAMTTLLDHDLRGGGDRLARAAAFVEAAKAGRGHDLQARVAATHARLAARRARVAGDLQGLQDAAALLDAALHGMKGRIEMAADAAEARLDRAALTLEAGVEARDPRLLDQAGRDLRTLVEDASPDYQPLTRARALTLCAAGLGRLADLAADDAARLQAHQMSDAAAEAFTQDHSPLDWAAIQVARAADGRLVERDALAQAETLTAGEGLILGGLAREARTAAEVTAAEQRGDLGGLAAIEARLFRRLRTDRPAAAPLDWVADQIGLASVAMSRRRLGGGEVRPGLQLALMETAAVAVERGVPTLAHRADMLREGLGLKV